MKYYLVDSYPSNIRWVLYEVDYTNCKYRIIGSLLKDLSQAWIELSDSHYKNIYFSKPNEISREEAFLKLL